MKRIIAIVLESVFMAVIVIFLIIFLLGGKITNKNGAGIFTWLSNSQYRTMKNGDLKDELTAEYNTAKAAANNELSIKYVGNTLEMYEPSINEVKYDIRTLFNVTFGDKEYTWNGTNWSSETEARNFKFYIKDITTKQRDSVLIIDTLENVLASGIGTKYLVYDEDKYELSLLKKGRYRFVIEVTDQITGKKSERVVGFAVKATS